MENYIYMYLMDNYWIIFGSLLGDRNRQQIIASCAHLVGGSDGEGIHGRLSSKICFTFMSL
jgi:hypothetical protein